MSDSDCIIGLGEVLWDVFGETRRMGGAPVNFAAHAAAEGLPALALSAVGDDAGGRELLAALHEAGLPCHMPMLPWPTGEVDVCVDGMGQPSYRFRPDVAWDHLEASEGFLGLARRTRLVCFGTLAQRSEGSRAAIAAFLAAMPEGEDRWRVLDINLRGHFYTDRIIRDSLRAADALKINDEEMEIVARREGFNGLPQREQARRLMERYGLRLLILTCGSLGSHVLSGGGESRFEPAPKVHVVDSVGAGDAFTATFFAHLLRGQGLPEAHRAATVAAARVCSQKGAMPQRPDAPR